MADCTPSSYSWAFSQQIELVTRIDCDFEEKYNTGDLKSESQTLSKEDWDLARQAAKYVSEPRVQSSLNLDDPKFSWKPANSPYIHKEISTKYTLTFRRTANICYEGSGCENWYISQSVIDAMDSGDLDHISKRIGKKVRSITDLGLRLQPSSKKAEEDAKKSHANKIEAVEAEIYGNTYNNVETDQTYEITSSMLAFIPKTYWYRIEVNFKDESTLQPYEYDTIDLPILGISWFAPKQNYNVQKTRDLLSGWDGPFSQLENIHGLYNEISIDTQEYYLKLLTGTPGTVNPYQYLPPKEWKVWRLKGYGYKGDVPTEGTTITVNQNDTAFGIGSRDSEGYGAAISTDRYSGEPVGPPLYTYTVPHQQTGEPIRFYTDKNQPGASLLYQGVPGASWRQVGQTIKQIYNIVKDKRPMDYRRKDEVYCTTLPTVEVKGKDYDSGTGTSCRC